MLGSICVHGCLCFSGLGLKVEVSQHFESCFLSVCQGQCSIFPVYGEPVCLEMTIRADRFYDSCSGCPFMVAFEHAQG